MIVLVLLLLASVAYAQLPPPPPAPPSPGDSSEPTPNSNDTATPPPEPVLISEPEATPTPISAPLPTAAPETGNSLGEVYRRISELETKGEDLRFYFMFVLAIDVVIIGWLVFLTLRLRGKKHETVPPTIKHFIRTNLKAGHRAETITNHLRNEGWSEKIIKKAFEEVRYGT